MSTSTSIDRLLFTDDNYLVSLQVVQIILRNRKVSGEPCSKKTYCSHCSDRLFQKISSIVSQGKPITFVIPAYPFPMPNPRKSFGIVSPDRAELLSMQHLRRFCQAIESVYSPGANIIIAADGDVLRPVWAYWFPIPEDVPLNYLKGLGQLITDIGAEDIIKIWSLRDAYHYNDVNECRTQMLRDYPVSFDKTCEQIKQPNTTQNLAYIGQKTYFAKDGQDSPIGNKLSGRKLKQVSGELACQATHLAEAWSHRISLEFPEAVRLSVHPYPAHFSEKIGIFLTDTQEEWMTPWHGVAVYYKLTGKWEIMKNYKAQELGGKLVCRPSGQPDYYVIENIPDKTGKH